MAVTVNSVMSGIIEEIVVSVGQRVGADDEVIILSSMKMEIPVQAGAEGLIAEILVDEGDAVTAGMPLFTIGS